MTDSEKTWWQIRNERDDVLHGNIEVLEAEALSLRGKKLDETITLAELERLKAVYAEQSVIYDEIDGLKGPPVHLKRTPEETILEKKQDAIQDKIDDIDDRIDRENDKDNPSDNVITKLEKQKEVLEDDLQSLDLALADLSMDSPKDINQVLTLEKMSSKTSETKLKGRPFTSPLKTGPVNIKSSLSRVNLNRKD